MTLKKTNMMKCSKIKKTFSILYIIIYTNSICDIHNINNVVSVSIVYLKGLVN